MADNRAAARYAKALIELSLEKGVMEEVHTDMQSFAQVVAANRGLDLMLQSPIVAHVKKYAVLKEIFQNRVHPVSFSIIEIITRKNREELLPSIATEFHKLYNSHKNIQVAEVTTTYPLDATQRQEFTDLVKRISGKQVELREKVDPGVIGGFVLQVGDQQIDESIKTKLQRLKYQMVKS